MARVQLLQDGACAIFRRLGGEPELDRLVVPDGVEPGHQHVAVVRSQEEISILVFRMLDRLVSVWIERGEALEARELHNVHRRRGGVEGKGESI